MFRLKGVIPPMVTPFKENGDLDEETLKQFVATLSQVVDGLFICGSYGSGALMSLEERKRVAEIVRDTAAPGTVVVAHVGTTNAKDTIELTKHAQAIGCDAASAVGPYYYKYQDKDLVGYYTAILEACPDIPFYIYHNPGFQGYETSLDVLKELKKRGLSGVKDATFDIIKYATYQRELADEEFDVALGTEAMWVSAHALGCEAYIPGIGNVFPELCKKLWTCSMNGESKAALDLQFKLNELRTVLYLARSTQLAIYAIAEIIGLMKAYPRLPFVPATEEEKANLKDALKKMEII